MSQLCSNILSLRAASRLSSLFSIASLSRSSATESLALLPPKTSNRFKPWVPKLTVAPSSITVASSPEPFVVCITRGGQHKSLPHNTNTKLLKLTTGPGSPGSSSSGVVLCVKSVSTSPLVLSQEGQQQYVFHPKSVEQTGLTTWSPNRLSWPPSPNKLSPPPPKRLSVSSSPTRVSSVGVCHPSA